MFLLNSVTEVAATEETTLFVRAVVRGSEKYRKPRKRDRCAAKRLSILVFAGSTVLNFHTALHGR